MTVSDIGRIKHGDYTRIIYTMIKDGEYKEVIKFLTEPTQSNMTNTTRAGLSLLGYCYYNTQDFLNASQCYEQLLRLYPKNDQYRLYYAQCLYQCCLYDEAMKILFQFNLGNSTSSAKNGNGTSISNLNSNYNLYSKIYKLQAAIKYSQDELNESRSLLEQISFDDHDKEINLGCILYKEQRYDECLIKFLNALQIQGYKPDLSYNIALTYYQMKQYNLSLKYIGNIIESGIRDHPELSVGLSTEGIEVRSVGNTITLHETALVEAFNLKAAIEYQLKNFSAAQDALTDMPPRMEEELDAVTLHNQALILMDTEPTEGFEKLQFLLQQNPFPYETFANLLILYCKHEYYDLAADVMAENAHFTYKYLTPYLYEFLDALITQQTSPEEAYRKFDELLNKYSDQLRKQWKAINEAKQQYTVNNATKIVSTPASASMSRETIFSAGSTNTSMMTTNNTVNTLSSITANLSVIDETMKRLIKDYEVTIEHYIPILMSQARIYWDLGYYEQIEKVFRRSVEFCSDNDIWQLNVAHVLFMQENKFKEATGFYEPLVKKSYDNILNVNAVVLANLCVSYIMTGQNEDAEELMRKIEKEEEQLAYSQPDKRIYHLCTVNLVIGTLYCSKGNYEFGISRIIKSLEPYNKKLAADTWFYVKRCFLALLENLAKQVIIIKDSIIDECIQFLTHCEEHGKNIKTSIDSPLEIIDQYSLNKQTIANEARLLKSLLIRIMQ